MKQPDPDQEPLKIEALPQPEETLSREAAEAAQGGGPLDQTYRNLGGTGDGDITAIAFIVLQEAASAAGQDTKAIMDHVRYLNSNPATKKRGPRFPP